MDDTFPVYHLFVVFWIFLLNYIEVSMFLSFLLCWKIFEYWHNFVTLAVSKNLFKLLGFIVAQIYSGKLVKGDIRLKFSNRLSKILYMQRLPEVKSFTAPDSVVVLWVFALYVLPSEIKKMVLLGSTFAEYSTSLLKTLLGSSHSMSWIIVHLYCESDQLYCIWHDFISPILFRIHLAANKAKRWCSLAVPDLLHTFILPSF